jgi:arsenate reductase
MIKVYHNPKCSKSRCALDFLNEKALDFEVIDYLKNPLTEGELKQVLNDLGIKAEDLLRKGEDIYKTNYKGKSLSEEEWVKAMIEYPKLMERPIIVKGNRAVIGRPTERILELLY